MPKYAHIANVLVGWLVKSSLLETTIPVKVMSYLVLGKPIVLAMDGEIKNLINTKIQWRVCWSPRNAEILADNTQRIYHMCSQGQAKLGKKLKFITLHI